MNPARTRIKICGIREAGARARSPRDAGADAIGLVFYRAEPALRGRRSARPRSPPRCRPS